MAERDAAIHTAGGLLAEFARLQAQVELVPIAEAFKGRAVQRQLAQVFDKASGFAHTSKSATADAGGVAGVFLEGGHDRLLAG